MEDGVQQKVSFFSKEEVPLLYGLVIDNSGSIRRQLDDVVRAGRNIVAANRPGDETFLVRFVDSKKIKTLQSFTSDKEALGRALDDLFIEGGQTALLDALAHSAQQITQYRKGNDSYRRALILVTDGEEHDSRTRLETLIDSLRLADVQIFVIGLVEALDNSFGPISGSLRDKAVRLLDRLAKETGGRAFYPRSSKEIPIVADELMRALRTQYIVGYTPASNPKSKSYRAVQVTVADAPGRGKLTAITRAGYTVPHE
jgi:Ca-activated chloride channel family protein